MRIRFILGPAGSGKTRLCYDRICETINTAANSDPAQSQNPASWLFLVPEQASYQAEREILSRPGIKGYSGPGVVSFSRLAFLLGSGSPANRTLGRVSRQIVILKVMDDLRGKLDLFDRVEHSPALADQLGGILREFQENELAPGDITSLAENLLQNNPAAPAGRKYRDLAILYQAYLNFIEPRFENPDQWLSDAADKVKNAHWLKNAHLWIDGFSGFTPQQLNLLIQLIRHTQTTHLALCLDPARLNNPSDPDDLSLFHTTEQTYHQLQNILRKNNIKIEQPLVLTDFHRFRLAPALAFLEDRLRTDTAKTTPPQTAGQVEVIAASNIRSEVHFLVRKITQLVREKGYRYSDIGVILSDPKAYENYLESALEDYAIPFFFDRPRPLSTHPAVEMLAAALETITTGFETAHVLAWLKCPLVGPDRQTCDTLETYALATGIRPGEWTQSQPWTKQPKKRKADLAAIDQARRQVTAPLVQLQGSLTRENGRITATQFCTAIWQFLEDMNTADWLASQSEQPGDEHAQLYTLLIDFLDDLTVIFADDEMSLDILSKLFIQGLGQLHLALIPPRLDQLLVGTIDRSRHPDLRAVFLLGTTQNSFPEPLTFDAILTDTERNLACEHGLEITEGLMDRLTDREYLSYIALTRPAEYLCLTRPVVDAEGSALMPASATAKLTEIFPDLKEHYYHPAALSPEQMTRPFEITDRLCDALGADSQLANDNPSLENAARFAASLSQSQPFAPLYDLILRGLEYSNTASLDPALAKTITVSSFSNSRLRRFAACPYQHFAHDLLDLRDREIFQLEAIDLGNFYHAFFEAFFRRMQSQNLTWQTIDTPAIDEISQAAFTAIEQDQNFDQLAAQSQVNRFILETAKETCIDAAHDYAQIARAGAFTQSAAEIKIRDSHLFSGFGCEITTPAGRNIRLNGTIDRLDLAQYEGKTFAAVFDYKLTGLGVNFSSIYHGLDLQGGIYLLAAQGAELEGKKIDHACGFFYLPIEPGKRDKPGQFRRKARGFINGETFHLFDDSAATSEYFNFYVTKKDAQYGYANISSAIPPDDFQALLGHIRRTIARLADGICEGKIDAAPYRMAKVSPCSRCDYRPVCRFDWKINPYRVLEKFPTKTAALQRIIQDRETNGDPQP